MSNINELRAAKKFGPGYFIREQMEVRGWVQQELADILSISLKHLNSILLDKQPLTTGLARLLSKAFGTSPQYWLNIDNDYKLWLEKDQDNRDNAVAEKAVIYSCMPVRDMVRKGWIDKPENIEQLKKEVSIFWGVKEFDPGVINATLEYHRRKSDKYNQFNASYAATWLQMAKKVASGLTVPKYNKKRLEALFDEISSYTNRSAGIGDFLDELNASGIKFYVLPHLDKTYLDGAAFLDGINPVIVYTGRNKRINNFWFTVAHEIAHVLFHLDKQTPFILDNLSEETEDKKEWEANRIASEKLLYSRILEYMKDSLRYLPRSRIEECSQNLGIHPAIIIGALAHNKTISYKNIHLFNENVLKMIPERYLHESLEAKHRI
jgi:HTH-type transcriptional regulator / antitoxin HigA